MTDLISSLYKDYSEKGGGMIRPTKALAQKATAKVKKTLSRKTSPENVADAFDDFLKAYRKFREDNGLTKPVGNIFEICTSMTDKHGRICRQIKHFERNDAKEDWPIAVVEAFSGYVVYMHMILDKYNLSVHDGMVKELQSAMTQYSKK